MIIVDEGAFSQLLVIEKKEISRDKSLEIVFDAKKE
jgi:hypothetical protein